MPTDFTHCASSCKVGGHSSYGECLRAKGLQLGALNNSNTRTFDGTLEAFAQAKSEGLRPERCDNRAIAEAYVNADA